MGDDAEQDDAKQTDEPSEERLDEIEDDIQKARAKADEAVDGFAAEPDEAFVDSGTEDRDEDDQTIAPPG